MKYCKTLHAAMDEAFASYKTTRDRLAGAYAVFEAAERAVARVNKMRAEGTTPMQEPTIRKWLAGYQVLIRVDVENFRDVALLLEVIEDAGFVFKSTYDWPAASERSYDAKPASMGEDEDSYRCYGIRVEARLLGEGVEGCRRIVTGYRNREPEPIYGFDCSGDAAQVAIQERAA